MANLCSVKAIHPSFSSPEIRKMDKLLVENNDAILSENFYRKLTEEINVASGLRDSEALQMKQVQAWFESIRKCQATEGASSPTASKDLIPLDISLSNDEPEDLPKADTEDKASEVTEREFEAKSSKDDAWYDVDKFLNHRFGDSGDLEVRVRFNDYGAEHDEWVNVKRQVRERSIPLDKTDCTKVLEGDLVLCFRETGEHAMYFDAYVTAIVRRQHDIRGCRCLFAVHYCHDQSEEVLTARKVCRRPSSLTSNLQP